MSGLWWVWPRAHGLGSNPVLTIWGGIGYISDPPRRTPLNMDEAAESPETSAQDAAFHASRQDRDRTLQAIRDLEAALGMAAGGTGWLEDVVADLGALEEAMKEEQLELNRPDSLLAMIAAEHPRRFGSRIRNVRGQYDDISRQVASLRRELGERDEGELTAGDLRQRAGWIIRSLHHCRARQTDLVYEALRLDLGER